VLRALAAPSHPPPHPPHTHTRTPLPQALDAAKADTRVQGLLAYLGERASFEGLAQVQELRGALIDFRVRLDRVCVGFAGAGAAGGGAGGRGRS
jgi:hypothetical protein